VLPVAILEEKNFPEKLKFFENPLQKLLVSVKK
jgi:hypothetical protein